MKLLTVALLTVENGATLFRIESRFPIGAIVPGQPAGDAGRKIIVHGMLGDNVTLFVTYLDSETDTTAGSLQTYKGKATFTESGKAIHVELGTAGSDGIQSFDFDAPSI